MLALAQVSAPQASRDRNGTNANAQGQPQNAATAAPQSAQATQPQAAQAGRAADQAGANQPARQASQPNQRQGLGLQLEQSQNGLAVAGVQQSSLAAQAGFRQGDRILSVDGQSFNSPRQLQAYLGGQYGRRVPVIVERGGRQYTMLLPLDQQQGDIAWLGVYLHDSEDNQRGAEVMQVYPSGPAARAGLRPGDLIQQVNGQQVGSSADLIAAIEEMQPSTKAELSVLRNNEPTKLTATLGSRNNFIAFRGGGEDARGGGYGGFGGRGSEFDDNDDSYNFPPHAMELEHTRRMAEQHERIENEIAKLRDEVRQLRETLQKR